MKRKFLLIVLLAIIAWIGCAYVLRNFHPSNRIPKTAMNALENPSSLILYSLHPSQFTIEDNGEVHSPSDEQPKFQEYRILAQITLPSLESQKLVATTLLNSVRNWHGSMASCFNPRHGIRVTDASGTYDFLICFECSRLKVFSPNGKPTGLGLASDAEYEKSLNDLLKAATAPLPTK